MICVLFGLLALGCVAFGFSWLADRPGGVTIAFQNLRFDASLPVAAVAALLIFIALWIALQLLRVIFGAPGFLSARGRDRQRDKGRRALSRGMIAAAAGDSRAASRASIEASRRLGEEPMTLLLEAQAAQLSGDRAAADRAFARMADRADTRMLGLRGLHAEARRQGDADLAYDYAARANAIAPLPWAVQAVLERHTSRGDWANALAAVETNASHKAIDRKDADRQRAVLMTAMAIDLGDRDPDRVLRLSQDAMRLAPNLTPAAVTAAGILTRRQEVKKAVKTLEAAWRVAPHPDLARAYLNVRLGDSATDRLARAETLARIDRDHPEARMILARAAQEAREFLKARRVMAPLIADGPPTRRMCLLMADIEEAEHGETGALREWLARAARAPRDPAWVADGFVSDIWAPVSPVTGRLDAFVWRTPDERLSAPETPHPPVLPLPSASPAVQTEALALDPLPAANAAEILASPDETLSEAEIGARESAPGLVAPDLASIADREAPSRLEEAEAGDIEISAPATLLRREAPDDPGVEPVKARS